VKKKLNQHTFTPQTGLLLTFAGKQLEDAHTVADCNLQSNATLHMVPRFQTWNLQFSVPLVAAVSVGVARCVLTADAAVFLAAVLEYMCAEAMELSGNAARDNRSTYITPRHVMLALRNDVELNELTKHWVIRESGAFPDVPLELPRGLQYNPWEDEWEKTFRDMQESAPHCCLVDPRDGRHYMLCKVSNYEEYDELQLAVQRPVPQLDQDALDVQRRAALEGLSEAQSAAFDRSAANSQHTKAFRLRCVRVAQLETHAVIPVGTFRAVTEDIMADSLAGPSQITAEALGLLQTATEGYLLHVLRGANRSAIHRNASVIDAKDIQLQSAIR
jgi:histone H3/H4